jgi:Fic-DOC domain mobile mystery protein B
MTGFEIHYPPGATPLTPDEREGLIPEYISTHGELNELEHKNIQDAILWAHKRRFTDILTASFTFELHKQMFGQVWRWAGKTRRSGKNIGVDWTQISSQLRLLFDDTQYWNNHKTFGVDEIATRFHHRLVQIHAFPNGNGRHARLMTDLLLESTGHEPFSWGSKTDLAPLETIGDRRQKYIRALQSADKNQYDPLISFVRS